LLFDREMDIKLCRGVRHLIVRQVESGVVRHDILRIGEDKVSRPHRSPPSIPVVPSPRGSRSPHVERTFAWIVKDRRFVRD
jgi:hypothetical protein